MGHFPVEMASEISGVLIVVRLPAERGKLDSPVGADELKL
jgi:hypothetical protein